MFHEALQMVHNNQRMKAKSINLHKIGNSTNTLNKTGSEKTLSFGSSVAIHKLRESKWFNHSESKILCSVVESGFILEKRFADEAIEHDWGIAIWKTGYGKFLLLNLYF